MRATEILKDEHRNIERMLNILESAARSLTKGESVEAGVFHDAINFIQHFADGCHHHKEETLLFPALIKKGFPPQSGPIGVMLYEHDKGRSAVRAMKDALGRMPEGKDDLVRSTRDFVSLLRDHIAKEDNVLFMMADSQLSEGEQESLLAAFTDAEQTSKACSTKAALLQDLERLEARMKIEETS